MQKTLIPNLDPHALAHELSGKHLIDGAFCAALSGACFDVIDPATGAVIGKAAKGDSADVDAAVTAIHANTVEVSDAVTASQTPSASTMGDHLRRPHHTRAQSVLWAQVRLDQGLPGGGTAAQAQANHAPVDGSERVRLTCREGRGRRQCDSRA